MTDAIYYNNYFKSDDYPTIVLITDPLNNWLYVPFQKFANIIHIYEDSQLSKLYKLKR